MSHCSVIMEGWRDFTLLLLWIMFSIATGIILVYLELGRFGQSPRRLGSSWKRFQSIRPSQGTETCCLLVFPPVVLELLLDLQPSTKAPTGTRSHAHICVQLWGSSDHSCSRERLLEKSLGEQPGRHCHVPSPTPQHHHPFGFQPWWMPADPVGVPRQDFLQHDLFKAFRALTPVR